MNKHLGSNALVLLLILSSGCITRSGGALSPVEVPTPVAPPAIEQTVGDFEFTLDGGKMVTSNKAGRNLNNEILKRWKKRGYISDHEYVKSSAFTGDADWNLTLTGSQYGESSVVAQVFSGLTLLILPYTVNTSYDVQYTAENVRTGDKFSAGVADGFHATVELFLVFAAPWSMRGFNATMDAMADHLYLQLVEQGAFAPSGSEPVEPSASEAGGD